MKVRGKVVKFTPQIMGKNWIHVQDGTGADGTKDLTVTTIATANRATQLSSTAFLSLTKTSVTAMLMTSSLKMLKWLLNKQEIHMNAKAPGDIQGLFLLIF